MVDISSLHDNIEESVALQNDWGTDNWIGTSTTDVRGMSEDELEEFLYGEKNGSKNGMSEDEMNNYLAEQFGLGITRQGGNY